MAVNYPSIGLNPRAVVVGELGYNTTTLTGNTYQDMVTVNSAGTGYVTVYLGNGNGTFQAPMVFATGLHDMVDVKLADMDGDGYLDVVTSGLNAKGQVTVVWLKGDGTGHFTLEQTLVVPGFTGQVASTLAVGYTDSANPLPQVVVADLTAVTLISNTGGVLTAAASPLITGGKDIWDIALADLNHDGNLDLVALDYATDDSVTIWTGNGDGTFSPLSGFTHTNTVGLTGADPLSLAIADVNDDGNYDIVVADSGTTAGKYYYAVSVLLNNGNATFQPQIQTVSTPATGSHGPYQAVTVGDLNGDGIPDVVLASNANLLTVLLGNGNGTFQSPINFSLPGGDTDYSATQPSAIALADLNNDGGVDIIQANSGSNNISVMLKTPATLTDPSPTPNPANDPTITVNPLITKGTKPTLTGTVSDPAGGGGIVSVKVSVGGQTLTAKVTGDLERGGDQGADRRGLWRRRDGEQPGRQRWQRRGGQRVDRGHQGPNGDRQQTDHE